MPTKTGKTPRLHPQGHTAGTDLKRGQTMNKIEQDTLEIIQEFLPRIALALEKIANQSKEKQNENQH